MLTFDGIFAGYGGGDILKGVDLTVEAAWSVRTEPGSRPSSKLSVDWSSRDSVT
jgi:hypothetical protein